ncbi:MAG: formylglycine-generating enzyme family protein [Flavobacteriales bacterium]|nr:formylglycine-generating enzyme family protein [Flavobacteriales bacterium]
MKYTQLILLGSCMLFAFSFAKEGNKKSKGKGFIPPGTVKISDSLFMDKTEISNFSWLEYEAWTKRNEPEKRNSVLPDTNLWITPEFSYTPFEKYYHRHSAYRNYPAVAISFQQAKKYCRWRTAMVNHMILVKLKKKKYEDPIDLNNETFVVYRLPTKSEWEKAAFGDKNPIQYPYGVNQLKDPKSGKSHSHTREDRNLDATFPNVKNEPPTCKVDDGIANAFLVYHLIGNVSEMLNDSIVIGLSHNDFLRNEHNVPHPVNRWSYYQKPSLNIGFRCVCEIRNYPW